MGPFCVTADPVTFHSSAAKALLLAKEDILREWEGRVRSEVKGANAVSRPVLLDTLPVFLVNIAQALDCNHAKELASESSNVAKEHGSERARVTNLGPEQILAEYVILREIVEQKLTEESVFSEPVRRVLERSFDISIQEAMVAFFIVHSKLRNQFVATLSHDLRTPLGAAKLSSELLLRKLAVFESTEKNLEGARTLVKKIILNLSRSDRMIQSQLDESSVQLGERLVPEVSSGDLFDLVRSIVEEMSDQDLSRVHFSGESTLAFCDFNLMRRAVENLISNALKYGSEKEKISIKVSHLVGRGLISVHNWGVPLSTKEQSLLFDPTYRTSSAKQSREKGWGLGLAFVRAVTESHFGSVAIESCKENGTTFTINFPADIRPLLPEV